MNYADIKQISFTSKVHGCSEIVYGLTRETRYQWKVFLLNSRNCYKHRNIKNTCGKVNIIMYSFDIFNTLITRNTASPYGVFLIMQEKLPSYTYSKYFRDNFVYLRIKAENNARVFNTKGEITLRDIYRVLMQMSDLVFEDIDFLMSLELQTEIDCMVEIKENINRVIDFYEQKEKVVLISDMYLSEKNIRDMLKNIHPVFKEIPIYVSCEYGCTKRSGMLYLKVKELEHAEYRKWTHYGDNEISDIAIANILGINTIHIKFQPLPLWEKGMIDKFDLKKSLAMQLVLGTTKKIRMNYKLTNESEIGTSLGGVILFPYIEWIIRQSIHQKLNRLYFIARDGYILKKIADIYIDENKLQLETKYIYGSRRAWRIENTIDRKRVREYLVQEVNFSDNHYAFVDLQGTGCSAEYLAEILDGVITGNLNFFYYNMIQNIICQPDKSRCNFMIYSDSEQRELIEVLCRAPHGATLGYKMVGGQYVPRLEDVDITEWKDCRLEDYYYGVELFAKEMIHTIQSIGINVYINELGDFLLERCCKHPDMTFLEFIGEIPHDGSILNSNIKFAPQLRKKNIFQIFMWRTSEKLEEYYHGGNLNYSVLRLDPEGQKIKKFYEENYNKLLGRVIHCYKRVVTGKWKCTYKKNIIIYAAGKYGKELYHLLQSMPGMKVVGWTDVNYKKCQQQGLPVVEFKKIINLDFDILVISIKDKRNSKIVKKLLIEAGIKPKKILEKDEFYEKYL